MEAIIEGFLAGLEGTDPRLCPYEKLTREWREWQRMYTLAVITFFGVK